jgi:glycosyltransferase involved in cell wall biosynthesis
MTEIAVIHRNLGVGGGESVCFHLLESLQKNYDLHLYALNVPNIEVLNSAFGTAVHDITVHSPTLVAGGLSSLDTTLKKSTNNSMRVDPGLELLALTQRYKNEWRQFDLRISTHGELPLSQPAIQYIHHPFLNRWECDSYFEIKSLPGKVLNQVYTRLIGATPETIQRSELLTNSAWSAKQIENIYEIRPDVLYPPVNTTDFTEVPWSDRESGFVSIGRLSPDKKVHLGIEIIDKVREQGYDTHLHHVGPINLDSSYAQKTLQAASQREWVKLEGKLSRPQLIKLIENHKWAVHTKPFEHFGMAVAEEVAGGSIPFIHSSGGQTEIINNLRELQYDSSEEAVTKITDLLDDQDRAKEIRTQFPDIQTQYGAARFKQSIQEKVGELLH